MRIVKSIENREAYRVFKCKCCGKRNTKEGVKISLPSQKDGIWLHSDCFKAITNEPYTIFKGDTDINSNRCVTHTTTIIVDVEDVAYFADCGYTVTQCLGKMRKVQNVNTSAYSAGKVVKKALEVGYKVYINDSKEAIKDFKEYKHLTDLLDN